MAGRKHEEAMEGVGNRSLRSRTVDSPVRELNLLRNGFMDMQLVETPYFGSMHLTFHNSLPPVLEGKSRGWGAVSRSYGNDYATIGLRVRTTDTTVDMGLVARVRQMFQEPEVKIELQCEEQGNIYLIYVDGVPATGAWRFMNAVDRAAKVFLEAKEIPQGLGGEDTKQLMAELSSD